MIQTEETPMTVRELQLTHVIEQQNEIMERLYNDSKEITERFDNVMEENKRLHDAMSTSTRTACISGESAERISRRRRWRLCEGGE